MSKKVLVAGATGFVGSQVVQHLLDMGADVRALVRPGSDATKLEALGVAIHRGDLTKKETLPPAMEGIDAIVTTAIGYMSKQKGDSLKGVDDAGNKNLVDAAVQMAVPKIVFNSILCCDKAKSVPHFWQKKIIEDYMIMRKMPFIALRPGAFLDQQEKSDFFAPGLRKGTLTVLGSKTAKWSFILTDDLARYLALSAIDDIVPLGAIDLAIDKPFNMETLAELASEYTGEKVKLRSIPWPIIGPILTFAGYFKPFLADLKAMFDYFFTGEYVADTKLQSEVFGEPPTVRQSAFKYFESIGLERGK
jgi:uncharacterized protein YbjT (DUF2867 family)